jgi:hypothetical protein
VQRKSITKMITLMRRVRTMTPQKAMTVRIPAYLSPLFFWKQLRVPVDAFHHDSDGYDNYDWR